MKKKMYALSGIFMIVLVISGLWATRAISLSSLQQSVPATSSLTSGMPLEQMAQEASSIVIVKFLGTRSQWIEGRRLVTVATVLVEENVKGDAGAGSQMEVELLGGIDPNRKVAMTYAGAPQLSTDEEAFLFLGPGERSNSYSVMGFAAGKFPISQDSEGQKVITPDPTRTRVQRGAGLRRGNSQIVLLSDFKKLVQNLLNK
jgi:hypothetical protein